MDKQNQIKYDEFCNKQREVLVGHIDRFVLRCLNYYHKLEQEENK